jgi:hypothetical protein
MMLGQHGGDRTTGNRHRARRRAPRLVAGVALAAIALGAAAYSSGTTAATTTTVTVNAATAPADIGQVYDTLFHFSSGTVASKEAVIQDGTSIKASLNEALTSSLAGSAAGTKIHNTNLLAASQCGHLSPKELRCPCGNVKYEILGTSGAAILPGNNGYAVFVGGHWLVAKSTICTLLGLFYTASGKSGTPPGC